MTTRPKRTIDVTNEIQNIHDLNDLLTIKMLIHRQKEQSEYHIVAYERFFFELT